MNQHANKTTYIMKTIFEEWIIMDDNKIIKIAAYRFIGLVVAPIVISGVIAGINLGIAGINSISYNRKIKNGLKDGIIVEIDGQYYEVKVDNN